MKHPLGGISSKVDSGTEAEMDSVWRKLIKGWIGITRSLTCFG
jgi:hypothetical protein